MKPDNDRHLREVGEFAKGLHDEVWHERMERTRKNLRQSAVEIETAGREMRRSLEELEKPRQEPEAEVSLTEEELGAVIWGLAHVAFKSDQGQLVAEKVRAKARQALRIETGPGGRFS